EDTIWSGQSRQRGWCRDIGARDVAESYADQLDAGGSGSAASRNHEGHPPGMPGNGERIRHARQLRKRREYRRLLESCRFDDRSGAGINFRMPGLQDGRIAGWQDFVDLARFRVQEILLVSSLYDSFTLAADGQLNELVLTEFLDLNLRHPPALTRVSTGAEAVERAVGGRYDLIISSLHVGDMDALTLARRVREAGVDTPVVLLAYDARAVNDYVAAYDASRLAGVFLWQG